MKYGKESSNIRIMLNRKQLEQVKQCRYLENIMTEDGRCSSEIRVRIAGKKCLQQKKGIANKELKHLTKSAYSENNGVECAPAPTVYGKETWSLRKENIKRLERGL